MIPSDGRRSFEEIVAHLLDLLEQGGRLTDRRPGSLVRTLVEAFARELTETYARIGELYRHGFIDSAEGKALDQLVALLDVTRLSGAAAYGTALFERDPRVRGAIHIPRDSVLMISRTIAVDAPVLRYRTIAEETIRVGADQASVAIATEIPAETSADEADGYLLTRDDLGTLKVALATPLAGVRRVGIPEPTVRRGVNEDDAALRDRVKGLLSAAGGGTREAIRQAVLPIDSVSAVELRDHGDDPALPPGMLEVIVDAELGDGKVLSQLEQALARVKGPGIAIRLGSVRERLVRPRLALLPDNPRPGLDERDRLLDQAEGVIKAHFDGLAVGQGLVWNRLLSELLSIDGILDLDIAASALELADAESWTTVPPGNLAAEPQTRIKLALDARPLLLSLGSEIAYYVNYAITIDRAAPNNRQDVEQALTQAFTAELAAIGAAADPALRVLSHEALASTLAAALGEIGTIIEARFQVTDPEVGWRSDLGAGSPPVALDPDELPRAEPVPPQVTWATPAP